MPESLFTYLFHHFSADFRNEALQFLCIYIDPTIPAQTDTVDAQQFLVLRSVQAAPPTAVEEVGFQTSIAVQKLMH